MPIKVYDGTRSDTSLCVTCTRAHIMKGSAHSQEVTRCHAFYSDNPVVIKFPVVECNKYDDTRKPSIENLMKIAWVVNADRRVGPVGFVKASKLSSEDRDKIANEVHDGAEDL